MIPNNYPNSSNYRLSSKIWVKKKDGNKVFRGDIKEYI